MYRVGITGGIGSGKTTASKIFEILGIPVYYADTRAKELMNTDPELKASLIKLFGESIYVENGLERKKLAGLIFSDKTALEKVNQLVHPAVGRDFLTWCDRQNSPYVMEEAAILFENSLYKRFWKIILVTAPESLRIERVCQRDQIDPDTVRQRMANQWPDEKKIALADYVIHNDESHLLIPQVIHIHHQLLKGII